MADAHHSGHGQDMHSGHDMHSSHDMHSGHDMHSEHNMHDHGSMATTVAQVITDAVANLHHQSVTDNPSVVDHSSHGEHSGHGVHSMMSMTFHGGYNETVLFDWWKFSSPGGLIGSIIAIFIMAVLYEGLKYYREHLFWKTGNALQYRAVQPPEEKANSSDEPRVVHLGGVYRKQPPSMCSKIHLWQTFLHAVQVTVSYFLMLVFMTYNSWLCLAVVLGAACGNFLFGWKKSVVVDVTEHCH